MNCERLRVTQLKDELRFAGATRRLYPHHLGALGF